MCEFKRLLHFLLLSCVRAVAIAFGRGVDARHAVEPRLSAEKVARARARVHTHTHTQPGPIKHINVCAERARRSPADTAPQVPINCDLLFVWIFE